MTERYGWDQTPTPDLGLDISKAPADIQRLYKWIIEKMYGKDVASAYGQAMVLTGIIAKNAEAMSLFTSGKMDALTTYVDDMLIEMTDKDIISAPEIIQMRDGEATANDRLVRDFGKLNQYKALLESSFKFVNPTMSLSEIQGVLITGGKIIFLSGVYEFDVPEDYDPYILNIYSDTIIEFDTGAEIKLKAHSNIRYRILNIENKSNIKIIGGLISGSRELNSSTTGEWGMGISIRGSHNVVIEDTEVVGCWGDGLYIGSTSEQPFSQNVTLVRFKADNNRRQGISVISVKGLRGDDVELTNTNGTAPEYGIDFEPNYDYEFLEDIVFNNLKTSNNRGSGIGLYLDKFTTKKNINMTFNNPSSVEDGGVGFGILIANFESDGVITVNNLRVIKSSGRGIYHRSISKRFSRVIYNNPILIDVNTSGLGGTLSGSPINIVRSANDYVTDTDFMLGNLEINNPQINYYEHTRTTDADIVIYDYIKEAAGLLVHSEDVTLNGIENGNIHRHTTIARAKIDDTLLPTYSYWPGTSPVTLTLPIGYSRYKDYEFTSSKQQILVLNNSVANDNGLMKIRTPFDLGSYRVYIRPPADERLYPLKYSSANGKGIYLDSVGGNGGSIVDLERIKGKWVIKTISGNWITE